jgi:hypothetical protein
VIKATLGWLFSDRTDQMNRTTRLAVLGTALAALLTPLLLLQPAQAAAPAYVALGDSYASGTGTRSYIADGTAASARPRRSRA